MAAWQATRETTLASFRSPFSPHIIHPIVVPALWQYLGMLCLDLFRGRDAVFPCACLQERHGKLIHPLAPACPSDEKKELCRKKTTLIHHEHAHVLPLMCSITHLFPTSHNPQAAAMASLSPGEPFPHDEDGTPSTWRGGTYTEVDGRRSRGKGHGLATSAPPPPWGLPCRSCARC